MELSSLSNRQVTEEHRPLRSSDDSGREESADHLQEIVQELEAQRVELEVQNRMLREARAELELSIQRYADLYNHLPLGCVTVTPEGRILQANLAAADYLQCDSSRLVGSHVRKFLDAYDAGRLTAHLENCARTGRPSTIELTFRLTGGAALMVQLSTRPAVPVPDGGNQIHIAITNISKLREVQRMLEEINREQEAFSYSISHDLRAPLVTITNYAGIVMSDHAAGLSAEGRTMVQRIECAATRMETTLKNLLRYSSLAREEIVLGVVNTDRVIADLLIEYRSVIEETKAEIIVERPLPDVRAAAPLLNQVLENLLTNALKYTEPSEPPRVRIAAELREATMILKVADEGIGIETKFHERIFQIFERLHAYSRYPGSGVGLAIARRAVERMHGRIWVESQLGTGSCFCLELPKA